LAERSLPFETVDAISHDGLLRNGIDRFKWQRPFTKGKLASSKHQVTFLSLIFLVKIIILLELLKCFSKSTTIKKIINTLCIPFYVFKKFNAAKKEIQREKELDISFHVSVLLLIMNFVIPLSKWLRIQCNNKIIASNGQTLKKLNSICFFTITNIQLVNSYLIFSCSYLLTHCINSCLCPLIDNEN